MYTNAYWVNLLYWKWFGSYKYEHLYAKQLSLIDSVCVCVFVCDVAVSHMERLCVLWFSICPNPNFRASNVFIMENISCRFYFMTALVFSSRFCHPFSVVHEQKKKQTTHRWRKKQKHTHTVSNGKNNCASERFCILFILLYFFLNPIHFRFSLD